MYLNRTRLLRAFIIITCIFFINTMILSSPYVTAEDNEDKNEQYEDLAKTIGLAAIAFFVAGVSSVVSSRIYKLSKKFLPDNDPYDKIKQNIRKFYLKTRKLFRYSHYICNLIAVGLSIIHGILLYNKSSVIVIMGLLTVGTYISYSLTGAVYLLRPKFLFKYKRIRKAISTYHRNIIVLGIIVFLHLVHVLIGD
ncbi:MAG: hypothetical protein ACTSPI_08090 [Candidatus Heimdallarchaeaceae archaeon]